MSQNQLPPSNREYYANDEIDLGELIANIWNTKWRVIIALVVVAALYIAFMAAQFLTSAQTTRYSQVFDLTFEGLSDGQFPDGSPFVMSDIIGPSVVNRVYRDNQLSEYGLTLDDFRRALSIEPYSPEYFLIRARYQQRLNNDDLSASEISDLQNAMQREMSVAQSGSVRLNLQLPVDNDLPAHIAQDVLLNIADTWAQRAIEERGVLRLNLPIYSARIFDESRFEELDYLIGIELLLDNIELIQGNVEALKEQPNAANVVDEQSGFNLEDLDKAIRDVAEYDLRQLIDPVQELGLTRNADVVRLFYNRQLQDLRLEQRYQEERARVTRDIMMAYSQSNEGGSTGSLVEGNPVSPQLGDAFLDRLIEISRQGGAQEFRQALTEQVLQFRTQALETERRIEEIQLTLDAIEGNVNNAEDELRASYAEEVQNSLPRILNTLSNYTEIIGRLHQQLGRQASGSISEIVIPQGGSFSVTSVEPFERRDILIFVALMVLTGFVSLFGSLVYDMLRKRSAQG